MTTNTIRKWIRNIDIFLWRWKTIPKKNVAPSLGCWVKGGAPEKADCGTIACVGGWISYMPEFAAMGVRNYRDGSPFLGAHTGPIVVGQELFGATHVFDPRYSWEGPPSITDKQVAINRFTKLRAIHVEALGEQA